MKFKPHGDRLLIEPVLGHDDKIGSILIPEAHRERQLSIEGTIVAIGSKITVDVKVGDHVIMERYRGEDIKMENRMFKLVTSKEILAIIE